MVTILPFSHFLRLSSVLALTFPAVCLQCQRPKTEGTRPQADISPSEEYSIGYSAQAW